MGNDNCTILYFSTLTRIALLAPYYDGERKVVCKSTSKTVQDIVMDLVKILGLNLILPPTPTPPPTPSPTTPETNPCPSDWHHFRSKCYLISNVSFDHSEAQEYCFSHNSTLNSVHNEDENNFINQLINIYLLPEHVWLGAVTDRQSFPRFWWLDGTDWNYSHWGDYEPSNARMHCVAIYRNNWHSFSCRRRKEFYALCSKAV